MSDQPLLFSPDADEQDALTLRAWLGCNGWQTRRDLAAGLGWSERKIRVVAELLGPEVVRGQQGFKLTANLTREDLTAAKQAADAALSQARKQEAYGLALLRKLHGMVG